MIHSASRIMTTESTTSNGVAKKLWRSQPTGPRSDSGAGIASTGTSRT